MRTETSRHVYAATENLRANRTIARRTEDDQVLELVPQRPATPDHDPRHVADRAARAAA